MGHEEWEKQTRSLMNFIRTEAKAPIFYLPKVHNPVTEKKLRDTRRVLEVILSERRRQLEEEIEELMADEEAEDANDDDTQMEHSSPDKENHDSKAKDMKDQDS